MSLGVKYSMRVHINWDRGGMFIWKVCVCYVVSMYHHQRLISYYTHMLTQTAT